jgi:hypothetical protein
VTGDIRRSRGQPLEERAASLPEDGGQTACEASGDVESCLIDLTGVDLDVVATLDCSVFSRSLNLVLRGIDQAGTAVARYKPY